MWFGEKELSKFSLLKVTCWLFYAENATSTTVNWSNRAKNHPISRRLRVSVPAELVGLTRHSVKRRSARTRDRRARQRKGYRRSALN